MSEPMNPIIDEILYTGYMNTDVPRTPAPVTAPFNTTLVAKPRQRCPGTISFAATRSNAPPAKQRSAVSENAVAAGITWAAAPTIGYSRRGVMRLITHAKTVPSPVAPPAIRMAAAAARQISERGLSRLAVP